MRKARLVEVTQEEMLELCDKAIVAREAAELEEFIQRLRKAAIYAREQIDELCNKAAGLIEGRSKDAARYRVVREEFVYRWVIDRTCQSPEEVDAAVDDLLAGVPREEPSRKPLPKPLCEYPNVAPMPGPEPLFGKEGK